MRLFTLLMVAGVLAGCTRPSSGIGLNDFTDATANDISEFYGWVDGDQPFPNGLCLASLDFEVKITNEENTGLNVSVPLAAPVQGISTVFDYDITISELSSDRLVIPFRATYPLESNKTHEVGQIELNEFIDGIAAASARPKIRDPKNLSQEQSEDFRKRTDLAAELWRIRESVHGFFLKTARRDLLLVPAELEFERSFTVTEDAGGKFSIKISGGASGGIERRQKVTDVNKLFIRFAKNRSNDQMSCNSDSLKSPPKPEPQPTLVKLVK